MLVVLAIGLGAAIAVYAVWRVPSGIGVLHAAAGLVVYTLIGCLWIIALFFSSALVERMVAPWRGLHLDGVFVVVLYFAPPLLAALVAVRVLGRDRMSR
jgi:hypothetical protein